MPHKPLLQDHPSGAAVASGCADPSCRSGQEGPVTRDQNAAPGAGFQGALLAEQGALRDALTLLPPQAQERLGPIVDDLYALLRTPIYPKGSYRALTAALAQAVAGGDNRISLYGVLASPTAMAEIGPFLKCVDIFRQCGFAPQLCFLLVQWENLIESREVSPPARARRFAQQVLTVSQVARHAGFGDVVVPLTVDLDVSSGLMLHPRAFRDWSHRIARTVREPRTADRADSRDVAWSTQFYARQRTLSRLGEQQALLDLAMRRAVGDHISAAHAAQERPGVMITSELHKRFLPCYAAALPILNLDVRAAAAQLGVPAVA
jgi:hypothetical protein